MPEGGGSKHHAYGICLGASTVTAVRVHGSADRAGPAVDAVIRRAHEGNPRAVFRRALEELAPDGGAPFLVTGRNLRRFEGLPLITEPEATEVALAHICRDAAGNHRYDALVSAGGETCMVYALDADQKIADVSTGNKCASGTGEFFLQQIRRMDLDVERASELALGGRPYAVSGRCSVFCKSDCTHALNKGEPVADVTAGLVAMMGQKITELLARVPHERVLMVGGTALNRAVIEHLRAEIPHLHVPLEAAYFEALGAALAALERGKPLPEDLFDSLETSFAFLPALEQYRPMVTFAALERRVPTPGDRCILGLDVGSTTTKAVLMRFGDHALLGSVYLRTNGNPVEASRACISGLWTQASSAGVNVVGIGVTGSGRQIAGLFTSADAIVNEIIAHATAAIHFDPEVDTIFEIGGQDAKYTHITGSVASDYAMNQACSAGTGSFLEEAALESLGVAMEEIAEGALRGASPPNFSDQCAAFISSDVKNAGHEGISRDDILAGLVYSICFNYINRVKGNRPVGRKILMQGGVCYNRAVPLAMAAILRKPIVVPPEPGLMGAFGVGLELEKRMALGLVSERRVDLDAIIQREIRHETPFTCAGGRERCDLKCTVARIRIGGDVFPFGGACNRYYNLRTTKTEQGAPDYVRARNRLMFDKYGPASPAPGGARRIGLCTSFLTLSLYPLYANFFSALGCEIVLPDGVEKDAPTHLHASMCYPAEIAIGLYKNLVGKRVDAVFIPFVKELPVPGGIDRQDFCSTCGFSRGEPFILKQAFARSGAADKILAPYVNLRQGLAEAGPAFVAVAGGLGFRKDAARRAFAVALEAQAGFEAECKAIGRKALADLRETPEATAVVLFGRPYNAYAPQANKGIPKKLTSRGSAIIPYEMLPYDDEPIPDEHADSMHWETGQRMLRAARIVKRDPQLYGVFVTNFLCAPDSFLVPYFRREMGDKPSLTLELDAHTADAGIDTRIEAFLDIVSNYRTIRTGEGDRTDGFRPARITYETQGTCYVDSDGNRTGLADPAVRLLIPSVGYFGNSAVAAIFRGLGIRALALPPSDGEMLRLGRSVTTGKECMPLTVCLGSLMRYLENRPEQDRAEKLMILIPRAAGHCRLGQYHVFVRQHIRDNRIRNVTVFDLDMDQKFSGTGPALLYNAWRAIVTADAIDDIECAIRTLAVDPAGGQEILAEECRRICNALDGTADLDLYTQLRSTAGRLARIPLRQTFGQTARVAVTGEFFVRRDHFSNLNIAHRLAERGFLVTIASLAEVMYYVSFMLKRGIKKPEQTLAARLERFISEVTQTRSEKKIKRILAGSGLYHMELLDVADVIRYSEHLIPNELDGEPGLISGLTMRDGLSKFAGVVNVGPFGCMQCRFADAITTPQADVASKRRVFASLGKRFDPGGFRDSDRIPYLSVESDGNPYPQLLEARFESFCLSATRAAEKMGKWVASGV